QPARDQEPPHVIRSPFRAYPSGQELETPPRALPLPLDTYVSRFYRYNLREGIAAGLYELYAELPLTFCGLAGAAGGPDKAPPGASHSSSICGISTFIHSMDNRFPGALPGNVTTNKDEWDKAADSIDHSGIGITAGTMVKKINENYRDKPGAKDGK